MACGTEPTARPRSPAMTRLNTTLEPEKMLPGTLIASEFVFGAAMFKETHPILGTRDIQRAIEFYTQQLGFKLAFGDKVDPPNYVGFRRDAVELHMQFQF